MKLKLALNAPVISFVFSLLVILDSDSSFAANRTVPEGDVIYSEVIGKKTFLCFVINNQYLLEPVAKSLDSSGNYKTSTLKAYLSGIQTKINKLKQKISKASGSKKSKLKSQSNELKLLRQSIKDKSENCASGTEQQLSDEFDDSSTLNNFSIFNEGPNSANYYETLDINTSNTGKLTLIPGPGHSGWYADGKGSLIYKLVSGNFLVETSVVASSKNDLNQAPIEDYNSAGLMVRHPSSASENYIMNNVGMQSVANGVGSESKNTVNSSSTLYLSPGTRDGRLRICRIGDTIYTLRFLSGDSGWIVTQTFERPDFPSAVQVGLIANGWGLTESLTADDPPDLHAVFDYIRYSTPTTASECSQ